MIRFRLFYITNLFLMQQADFIIRKAEQADATEIAEVYLASRKMLAAYAPLMHTDLAILNWLRDELITDGRVTVALLNEKIIGLCATSQHDNSGWIDQLYIDPKYLGQGTGTALLMHAKQTLQMPIRLYTFRANVAASKFYERHGFVAIEFGDGANNEEGAADILYEYKPKV